MKLFQCTNESCPAHRIGDARTNRVYQSVRVLTPLDEEGRPIDDLNKTRAIDYCYECGYCQMDVEEVTSESAMECRLTAASSVHMEGEFKNALRGPGVLPFRLSLRDGVVEIPGGSLPGEDDRIRDFCKDEFYHKGIEVEILDVEVREHRKVYQVRVRNAMLRREITVEATHQEVLEEYGDDPSLLRIEKQKVFDTIREARY